MFCCYNTPAGQHELIVQPPVTQSAGFLIKANQYRTRRPTMRHVGGYHELPESQDHPPIMAPRYGYFSPRGGYPLTSPWFKSSPQDASPRNTGRQREVHPEVYDPKRQWSDSSDSSDSTAAGSPNYVFPSVTYPTKRGAKIQDSSPIDTQQTPLSDHSAPKTALEPATVVEAASASASVITEGIVVERHEASLPAKTTVEPIAEEEKVWKLEVPVAVAAAHEPKEPPGRLGSMKATGAERLSSPRGRGAGKAATKASPRALGKAAGSEGGLMTRDRGKMTDTLDERDKKHVFTACNFMRETIETHPSDDALVPQRDRAFLLFMMFFAARLHAANKQHPVATACSHAASHAKGQIPTAKAKRAAPKVEFYLSRIAKPTLEFLGQTTTPNDAAYTAKDICNTARVSIGEHPAGMDKRTDYLEEALRTWSYHKAVEMAKEDEKSFNNYWRKLINALDDYRKGGGDGYVAVVDGLAKVFGV